MKLIYLHIYKDTYSIFMQAYKPLQWILNYSINLEKRKKNFPKIKLITNNKIRVIIESGI